MEIYPWILARMLAVSFLFAIQIGVVFDISRALRLLFSSRPSFAALQKISKISFPFTKRSLKAIKGKRLIAAIKNAWIFICDVILIIYSTWGLMQINYSFNNGGLRAFSLFGFLVGFLIYYFTLSRLVLFLLEGGTLIARKTSIALFDALTLLFYRIYNKIYNIFVKKIEKIYEKLRLRIEKKREKVYNVNEIVCKNHDTAISRVKVSSPIAQKGGKGGGKNGKRRKLL